MAEYLSNYNGRTLVTLGVKPSVENPLAETVADHGLPLVIMGYKSHSIIYTMPVVYFKPMIGLCMEEGGNGLCIITYMFGY